MAERFASRLVNGVFEDPALFVSFHYERRAMLFDLGRIDALSVKEILKLSDVFVSHTHIDHFIGFDHLLRCSLNRAEPLRLYGPIGFIDNVRGKLAGYTWNLIREYPLRLVIYEVDGGILRSVELNAADEFHPIGDKSVVFSGFLLEEPTLSVCAAVLEHKIPCLAFGLQESKRLNVRSDALAAMNLKSGPWLDELKRMLREENSPETLYEIPLCNGNKQTLTVERWKEKLIIESPGQKIAYVVDNQYNARNAQRIVSLARNADLFYCEASFSRDDQALAHDRFHLTAAQAGDLARQATVKRLVPFHFSARYESEPDRLPKEALAAFVGEVAG